jgi:hypothetical protein
MRKIVMTIVARMNMKVTYKWKKITIMYWMSRIGQSSNCPKFGFIR